MAVTQVSLDDKYTLDRGRVYLTGTQALVRLPIMQRQRDAAAGLNTGGFISGYRGSPLGAVDQQLWRAQAHLDAHHIHFQPGVNEDLAATAVWGTQQVGLFPGASVDGVFAMWYGKGPGVDRSGDVLRHGNFAGSAKHGGVLLLAGDDHTCKSSTTAHQTEYAFMDAMIPVLNPAGVQEFLDLGLYGFALSRYSGCWVAFKTIAETVDTSASCYVDPNRIDIRTPQDFEMPPGGLNIRWPDPPLAQEARLHEHKLYAALAFARANGLNRTIIDGPKRRLGIVTCGKSYLDVRQALEDLGITEAFAREIGISLYKVAMTWPLEREGMRQFAEGLEEILVVEEKRALIENQLKEQLYNWSADIRPRVIGKFDENGGWQLPSTGELTPARIARVIAARIARFHASPSIEERLNFLQAKEKQLQSKAASLSRIPYFCSGCPHNTSTRVPEGSRALAGIGCHYMAQWMDRRTDTFTQMGGEGVPWVGQAPFSDEAHIFANLGDGTYHHSGLLAIRQAIAANVNITYKILYNDAVAMTGGQPLDGPMTVANIAYQVSGEGAKEVVVVSDEPEKYGSGSALPPGTGIHHRDDLDKVQRRLRDIQGVTVLIYDQTCAAEKRRRRKRGLYPDPPKRVFINEAVCEGCGDCSVKSNCLSVTPKETEFGRKRAIDQSSCNKDYSCINGFCPSFVTVHGGELRKQASSQADAATGPQEVLPEPNLPELDQPYGILVTGIGGTGVVTLGALMAMAAHIEGKGCSVLDMAGLAQKGGAVTSHIRIARAPEDIHAVRIAAGGASLLLGCDIVVAGGFDALSKTQQGRTRAVINSQQTVTGDFTRDPDLPFPDQELRHLIRDAVGAHAADFIEGTALATALMGDAIAANIFMLGFAWQKGLVPIGLDALLQAIELNKVSVEFNKNAFMWGRRAAHDLAAIERLAAPRKKSSAAIATTLEGIVEKRVEQLKKYQGRSYARRYKDLVVAVQRTESQKMRGEDALATAVARYYYKLLAYKDEYEVARLFSDGTFMEKLKEQFDGDFTLRFHLAPPLIAPRDPETGLLIKKEFGPWLLSVFKVLTRLKVLRGTPLDIFGYTQERRTERRLIADYERTVAKILDGLTPENHASAVALASVPEHIRGYGHVKERHLEEAGKFEAALWETFANPARPQADAAE